MKDSILKRELKESGSRKVYPVVASTYYRHLISMTKLHLLSEGEKVEYQNQIGQYVYDFHLLEEKLIQSWMCSIKRGFIEKEIKALRNSFKGIADEIASKVKRVKDEELRDIELLQGEI